MKILTHIEDRGGVYRITCLKNGKQYIGSSNKVRTRLMSHWHNIKNQRLLRQSIEEDAGKYNINDFLFEIIEYIPTLYRRRKKEEILIREIPEDLRYNKCLKVHMTK